MATFIKAGFWEKLCKPCLGYKGWLNLDEFITNIVTPLIPPVPTPTYKVYTAILSQDSLGVVTVQSEFENTLGNVNFITSPYLGSIVLDVEDITIDTNGLIGFCYSGDDDDATYQPWLVVNAETAIYLRSSIALTLPQVNIRVDIKVYNYTIV